MLRIIDDVIPIAPDISGTHGRAWRCNIAAGLEQHGASPANDAAIVIWVIEAPGAHPVWHSYMLVLVHLRPLPNQTEVTKIYLDGATHEIWLYALHPETDRQGLIELLSPSKGGRLHPLNFAAQFIEVSDEAALDRAEAAVRKVCDGLLSPDQDYIRDWQALFGNNMVKEKYR